MSAASMARTGAPAVLTALLLSLSACGGGDEPGADSGPGPGQPETVEEVAIAFAESSSCEELERFLATEAESDRVDFDSCDDSQYSGPGSVGGNIITYAHNDDCTVVETESDEDDGVPSAKVTLSCQRGDIHDDSHGVYLVELDGRWKVVSVNS
ncbi:hypothetical protein ACFQ0K_12175 [Nocardioides caeni]|uniref:Nuclear transport factor 2 family protein n=1 Tax=Nocardioides caeni TaxID=574700 RepID=A0A4S8NMI7_9ACTN|nr:hypothetical protein [Nocardioides caeni]THV17805.1 hypothetical protein E9934_04895 [Nocardioides caeni]